MSESKSTGLAFAIVFTAIIIAGSLVFFSTQIGSSQSASLTEADFETAIENYITKQNKPPEAGEVVPVSDRDYIRGDVDAEISLIEYSDFECPFCKRAHPTFQEIINNNNSKVNWVYRHFPLGFHDPLASKQAEATECVGEIGGNDKFWAFADLIFDTTQSNGKGMEIADLYLLAGRIGLDAEEVKTCIESEKFKSYVQRNIGEGSKAGVAGTPGTIVINNKTGKKKLVSGAQPVAAFQAVIDELME